MGDCLRAGKPSRYVTSRLGQVSLSFAGRSVFADLLTRQVGIYLVKR